jgi:uncharacterized protein
VRFLLDINVLIALIDPTHVHHEAAHAWFEVEGARGWATCSITQNGFMRIVGNPAYPNSPGSPAAVAPLLIGFCTAGDHRFWIDDLEPVRSDIMVIDKLLVSSRVTDSHLLALAVRHGGKLATFDRRLSTAAVRGGAAALQVIDPRNPA